MARADAGDEDAFPLNDLLTVNVAELSKRADTDLESLERCQDEVPGALVLVTMCSARRVTTSALHLVI